MDCMNGFKWLNDYVINLYMGLLQQRELSLNPGEDGLIAGKANAGN